MTLFPLAEALARRDSLGVGLTLGSIAAGLGGNLLAGEIQRGKDRAGEDCPDEGEVAPDVEAALATSQELRQAADAILEELDLVGLAYEALGQADRPPGGGCPGL